MIKHAKTLGDGLEHIEVDDALASGGILLALKGIKGHRIENGPIQFGADWPGVFIRGDDALGYAATLRKLLISTSFLRGTISGSDLEQLADLLGSCRVTDG